MRQFFESHVSVPSRDADIQRRGRLLIILLLGILVVALLVVPVAFLQPDPGVALLTLGIGVLLIVAALALARSGRVTLGAWLFLAILVIAPLPSISAARTGAGPFYLVFSVLIASLIVQPRQVLLVLLAVLVGLTMTTGIGVARHGWEPMFLASVLGGGATVCMVALIGFLGAQTTQRAMREAQQAQRAAEDAAHALEGANADLEQRVADRTADLQQALDLQQKHAVEVQAGLDLQRRLNETIAALSVPMIPVRDDVLVAPLVGSLDGSRAQVLLQSVLERVEATRAEIVFLDVTGVAEIDTAVAKALLQTADAVRLLGAQTIVVGMRPDVAQTLVTLGTGLGPLRTAATLAEGLAMLPPAPRRGASKAARGNDRHAPSAGSGATASTPARLA